MLVVAAVSSALLASAQKPATVRVEQEQSSTVHVGQIASVRVPANHSFGGAAPTLKLVGRFKQRGATVYLYRAIRAGNATFVASPNNLKPGDCISCVTIHWFITIVP